MFMLKISKKTNFNIFLNITFITVLILNLYNFIQFSCDNILCYLFVFH